MLCGCYFCFACLWSFLDDCLSVVTSEEWRWKKMFEFVGFVLNIDLISESYSLSGNGETVFPWNVVCVLSL